VLACHSSSKCKGMFDACLAVWACVCLLADTMALCMESGRQQCSPKH
jgi:hypothetical protein